MIKGIILGVLTFFAHPIGRFILGEKYEGANIDYVLAFMLGVCAEICFGILVLTGYLMQKGISDTIETYILN